MGLTLLDVQRFTENDALNFFRRAKWPETFGGAVCPCGCEEIMRIRTRNLWKCKRCRHQFTEWSGTPFASSKLPKRDLLNLIANFAVARKGISANQLSKNTGLQYKTVFITLHKLREILATEQESLILSGVVEIDGALFGGYRRTENIHSNQFVKRYAAGHHAERRVLCVARQRGGRTLTFVGRKESDSVEAIRAQLAPGTIIQADGAHAWDSMIEAYEMLRIEHKFAFSANDACTNNAESFFSMMRRQQRGVHHKMSGDLLHTYAAEMAWRQDFRLLTAEELIERLITSIMQAGISTRWSGYWSKVPTRTLKKAAASPICVEVTADDEPSQVAACA